MDIDKVRQNLMDTLHMVLDDYSKYEPTDDIKKLLKVYTKLDTNKIAKKIVNNLENKKDIIMAKDETLFNNECIIIPGVNISLIWNKLTEKNKNKFWVYLQILYVSSFVVNNNLNITEVVENKENNENIKKLNFNPYDGLKGGDADVDTMIESAGKITVKEPGLESMLSMVGGDMTKLLENLSEELKNATDEEMDGTFNVVKNMLGKNSKDLDILLATIRQELKKENTGDSKDIVSLIRNISTNVSYQMAPKIQKGEVNSSELYNTAKQLSEKMMPGINPMELIKKMAGENKL